MSHLELRRKLQLWHNFQNYVLLAIPRKIKNASTFFKRRTTISNGEIGILVQYHTTETNDLTIVNWLHLDIIELKQRNKICVSLSVRVCEKDKERESILSIIAITKLFKITINQSIAYHHTKI